MIQLTLQLDHADIQRELRARVDHICSLNGGRAQVAQILTERLGYEVSTAKLSHALSTSAKQRKRHALRAEWLVVLVTLDGGGELVEFLASLRGELVVLAPVPTADQELAAVSSVLDRYPLEFRKSFKAAVTKEHRQAMRGQRWAEGDSE